MNKKKICFFSGNRAEFGLQKNIINEFINNKNLTHHLILSGAHLEKFFADSIKEIDFKKYNLSFVKNVSVKKNDPATITEAIGKNVILITRLLKKIKPDVFLIYADRYESFAAVVASSQCNIPTVHVEGGDRTEGGALDDSLRHAMTKLSHYHFCTNKNAFNRILNLGEEKWRVKNIGFPGCDYKYSKDYATEKELKDLFSFDKTNKIIIFTYHSIPIKYDLIENEIKVCFQALDNFVKKNYLVIITYPNNDAGGRKIISQIKKFANKNKKFKNLRVVKSLGRYNFYGFLSMSKNNYQVSIVGNSSSGLKDAGIFNCPAVNIGTRQENRLKGKNVIDSKVNKNEIVNKINLSLNNKFAFRSHQSKSPYDNGYTKNNILREINNFLKINKHKILNKKITY